MTERSLAVHRTARYAVLGGANEHPGEVWFVCHGYRQLARSFLGYFAAIDDGSRVIVAPEALSRFYVEGADKGGADAVVGASWMTREDRRHEISDYVSYLDTVYAKTFEGIDRSAVRVTILGFSQGAATVCRWIDGGRVRSDRLILWGGMVPQDVDWSNEAPVRKPALFLVVGAQDEYATPAAVAEGEKRLRQNRLPYELVRFEGGHHLNKHVLQRLASAE
ncbi:MAG: alpha/beta hydrolase [Candidatus Krumholzibacteriia bacterium]